MEAANTTSQDIRYGNRVLLAGHVKDDPTMWLLLDGTPIARFEVCIAEQWHSARTAAVHSSFASHTVVVIGKLVDATIDYLRASRPIEVHGRLRSRRWRDKDNREVTTTEIHADEIIIDGVPALTYP